MNYYFTDVESTSVYPLAAEILTADFIKCDSQLNILEERGFRFKPRIWSRDADEAVKIHGITKQEAMTYPPHKESAKEMMTWLLGDKIEKSYLMCHVNRLANRTYDAIILRMIALDEGLYFEFGLKFPEKNYISTHSLAKYAKISCALDLASLAKYLGIKQTQHHSSKDDVRVCYEIFKILIRDINLEDFLNWEYNKGDNNAEFQESKKRTDKKSREQKPHHFTIS